MKEVNMKLLGLCDFMNRCFYCIQTFTKTLVGSLHGLLNCEIGGFRFVVLLQQSLYSVSIVYTCNTYFVMHWSI